jgi:hypothetical protein
MKRSIADARLTFEETIRPTANAYQEAHARQLLEEAEQDARNHITARVEQESAATVEAIRDAQRELADVRDGYDFLATANMSATDLTQAMRDLRNREQSATAQLDILTGQVDELPEIEADPLAAYYDMTAEHRTS